MFKTGITRTLFKDFSSTYHTIANSNENSLPYFYADQNGVRIITSVVGLNCKNDSEICAMTMAEDGWIEIVTLV